MRLSVSVFVALLSLSSLPPAMQAKVGAPSGHDKVAAAQHRLEQLLAKVKAAQSSLATLQADFVQDKESALLAAPQESRGTFLFASPDRVRWLYRTPAPIRVVIHGSEMVTWYQDLGRADRVKIGRYSDQVFKYLGASNSLELLQRYFTVTVSFPADPSKPYRLDLTPRFARVRKHLQSMSIWLDPHLYVPQRLRYEEADGDVTEYRFENLRVNAELPPGSFDLDLPANVEVRSVALDRGR